MSNAKILNREGLLFLLQQLKGTMESAITSKMVDEISVDSIDSKIPNASAVYSFVTNAIENMNHLSFKEVDELPEIGEVNVIYMINTMNAGTKADIVWENGAPPTTVSSDDPILTKIFNGARLLVTSDPEYDGEPRLYIVASVSVDGSNTIITYLGDAPLPVVATVGDSTYTLYTYMKGQWKELGETKISLDNYWSKDELASLDNTDIQEIIDEVFGEP